MRRTHKVARKVKALLPGGLGCVGEIVFNPDFDTVVNGVIIDGTSYKDTVVAKTIQHTFFTIDKSLRLNYSQQIYNKADSSQVIFFVGHVDELAAQVATTLTLTGLVDRLRRPYRIEDFVAEHWPNDLPFYYKSRDLFDACCAHFLVGKTEAARIGFVHDKHGWDGYLAGRGQPRNEFGDARSREADEIVALLDGSDDALRQSILRNVDRNARLLGFEPVCLRS